jgi:hypothetical protein
VETLLIVRESSSGSLSLASTLTFTNVFWFVVAVSSTASGFSWVSFTVRTNSSELVSPSASVTVTVIVAVPDWSAPGIAVPI